MKKVYCLFRLGFSVILFAVCCAGCSLISLNEKPDDSERYGSLIIAPQNRVLDVSLIRSAVVTVSGNGINNVISEECGEVVNGRGSVFIEKIPIGKRRIISVYAKDATGGLIDGGVIRAVVEIKGGANTIDIINRQTSRKGNVYNALFEKNIDIENIKERDAMTLEEAIPDDDDCELERIDIDSLVNDFIAYKNGGEPLKNQENYILPESIYLQRIKIVQAEDSSEENMKFTATAIYSNGSECPITEKAQWISSDSTVATVENGVVTLRKAGSLSISAEYSEGTISRISPKANLTVVYEEASNPYIYLKTYGEKNNEQVNYAYQGAFVAAWIWGTRLLSEWYPLEKINDDYMRVEIPKGAENIIFARARSFDEEKRNDWDGMRNLWNKTLDLKIPTDGKNNTCVLSAVTGKEWSGATGTWSYVDHGDILESRIYATCKMEPSEDDTSLSSLKINGTIVSVANRVVYTVPYDTSSAHIEAVANYSEATVAVSPSPVQSLVNPGDVAEFIVTVTAKDGKNKQDYTVRVKRSAVAPLDLTPYKQCGYLEDEEEGTITFMYDPATWGETKDNVKSLVVVGSFTATYDPKTKKWVENTDDFTLSWNNEFGVFSLTVPREKVMRPGYSGQPEYKFYKNGRAEDSYPSTMPEKYIFGSSTKPMMILFKSDGEDRLSELENNKKQASTLKKLSDFNTSSDEDLHKIANFRQIPRATAVYRSYHPFYPTNEKTETEQLRIESVQKFATAVGIKSDINLCNDRTPKQGNTITYYNGTVYTVAIPEYYNKIIQNNSVLYMGDAEDGRTGNGYIPNAKLVYYHSHSEIFGQWVKQLIGFINDSNNSAPFQIHCEIGVDRTGVFCAVLAGLCGATWQEIQADFVSSNNMGIGEFRDGRMLKYSFENMLGVSDISAVNIKNELYKHFTNGGYVTTAELDAAVKKLTAN